MTTRRANRGCLSVLVGWLFMPDAPPPRKKRRKKRRVPTPDAVTEIAPATEEPLLDLAADDDLLDGEYDGAEEDEEREEDEVVTEVAPPPLPYHVRDDFLSRAEASFYHVLVTALGDEVVVLTKVNLADVFFVTNPDERLRYRAKINRKHVDFLICQPDTMTPLLGVELDDISHQRERRQVRDAFVDHVFESAALPLMRVPVKYAYNTKLLREQVLDDIVARVRGLQSQTTEAPDNSAGPSPRPGYEPRCPRCELPMVKRQVRRGPHEGRWLYGCRNYPACREVIYLDE